MTASHVIRRATAKANAAKAVLLTAQQASVAVDIICKHTTKQPINTKRSSDRRLKWWAMGSVVAGRISQELTKAKIPHVALAPGPSEMGYREGTMQPTSIVIHVPLTFSLRGLKKSMPIKVTDPFEQTVQLAATVAWTKLCVAMPHLSADDKHRLWCDVRIALSDVCEDYQA